MIVEYETHVELGYRYLYVIVSSVRPLYMTLLLTMFFYSRIVALISDRNQFERNTFKEHLW